MIKHLIAVLILSVTAFPAFAEDLIGTAGNSAEAYIDGDVSVVNENGNSNIAVGSAIGNIGQNVHTSATMKSLTVENQGNLDLAIGSVIGSGKEKVSNVTTSAHVGNLSIRNAGDLKMSIGSITP